MQLAVLIAVIKNKPQPDLSASFLTRRKDGVGAGGRQKPVSCDGSAAPWGSLRVLPAFAGRGNFPLKKKKKKKANSNKEKPTARAQDSKRRPAPRTPCPCRAARRSREPGCVGGWGCQRGAPGPACPGDGARPRGWAPRRAERGPRRRRPPGASPGSWQVAAAQEGAESAVAGSCRGRPWVTGRERGSAGRAGAAVAPGSKGGARRCSSEAVASLGAGRQESGRIGAARQNPPRLRLNLRCPLPFPISVS